MQVVPEPDTVQEKAFSDTVRAFLFLRAISANTQIG
ncbi:hypothetical protein WJX82_000843 [Trebouxia sp. C0006]